MIKFAKLGYEERCKLGSNSRIYFEREFHKEKLLDTLIDIIKK